MVIAIIGLLASIVLVSLNTARQKARDSRRLSDLRQVALALELYYDNNNNAYPLITAGCTSANWQNQMTTALEGGGYMTEVPIDPLNGATYWYAYSSTLTTGAEYVLKARLELAGNPAFVTDVDGEPLGCTVANSASCVDPAYCVMP